MKVAFFSDIHANFPALCAALETASGLGAEAVVCAGDLASGGPHPTEVVRLLMGQRVPAIRGNIDRRIVKLAAAPKKKRPKGKKWAEAAWSVSRLGEGELRWLSALPSELRLTFAGVEARVVHGSPLSDTDCIYPSLTPAAFAAKLGEDRPAVLVCGHSHIPFARTVEGVLVVNCGSVGRPYDGDPRGSFALCTFAGPAAASARIVRFEYPVEAVIKDLSDRGGPKLAPRLYRQGVKA